MHRIAAVDAQFYWMSAKVPNDEFLLYAFDGEPSDLGQAIEQVLCRARACPDLTIRVEEGCALTYPQWVPATVGAERVITHNPADRSWEGCLAAVVGLASDQLDIRRMPWLLHVFASVLGIPGVDGPGAVAVLQVPHAVADGVRSAAMAAWLFGRATPVPEVTRSPAGFLPWRAVEAARTHRQLVRDTNAGLVQPRAGTRPPLAINDGTSRARSARTLVRNRSQLSGPTVTVAVLAAVAEALSRLLDDSAESLGAEVPIAKPGMPRAHNHFGNVVVGLYPRLGRDTRTERIAADLANARRRFEHPAALSADRAFASVPAPLLRWGVSRFDPDIRPPQVAGNTVVSSVDRGAADLSFGGARVVLTSGYPSLSPLMGLTHGVHGIGDTVAISIHAAESSFGSVCGDVDTYVELLDASLQQASLY